ncbi:MAG TPA: aspartate kinase [Candidatus Rikenella faecigallinarum]|uniref:Aspartokinase n=1 Tax=Candidatus Rikenella faecigallinarum TaxID=2838745 RepID=A0A9D1QDJ3_9BACT|nr:aspartate kinase [Candidatus Rikenella faecigallinarum]
MIKTLKFGGTSVGSAANMRRVAGIIVSEGARLTVLSAMSGTTDALVKISTAAKTGDNDTAKATLAMLREKYTTCITELLSTHRDAALDCMEGALATIANELFTYRGEVSDKLILAQGELLTSAIFCYHMQELGHRAVLLTSPEFMHTDPEGKPDTARLAQELKSRVTDTDPDIYYIAQGFICTDSAGHISNLGRGGSDYSAALMGVAIGSDEVQIWTDIDGMHNNDPRVVENTFPIRRMSFDEAAELAYFGAKILHPLTIQPCKEAGINVRLKNSMEPEAEGTLISADEDNAMDFHAVAAKDGITVVRITSARMLMAYGFLRKVFEVFEKYKTPVDMITTSEVEVSLTIDSTCHLEEIIRDLTPFCTAEVVHDNTIVCIVGCIDAHHPGLAARIFEGLKEIPIQMISYGANHRSMAILVATQYKKQTLQALNDHLFHCTSAQ